MRIQPREVCVGCARGCLKSSKGRTMDLVERARLDQVVWGPSRCRVAQEQKEAVEAQMRESPESWLLL